MVPLVCNVGMVEVLLLILIASLLDLPKFSIVSLIEFTCLLFRKRDTTLFRIVRYFASFSADLVTLARQYNRLRLHTACIISLLNHGKFLLVFTSAC